jgi:hypothetical protein
MDMRIRAKEWKVIVTVEEEPINFSVLDTAIRELLDNDYVKHNVYAATQATDFKQELARLKNHRRRRGLIDGVGLIAHSLFGLATDSEVAEIKAKVEENRAALQGITTWANDWLTVVNASHQAAILNRITINNLTREVTDAFAIQEALGTVNRRLHEVGQEVLRQQRIRDDLEDGRLTELIFSPHLFQSLPHQADET